MQQYSTVTKATVDTSQGLLSTLRATLTPGYVTVEVGPIVGCPFGGSSGILGCSSGQHRGAARRKV
jgi:hypothetical protein